MKFLKYVGILLLLNTLSGYSNVPSNQTLIPYSSNTQCVNPDIGSEILVKNEKSKEQILELPAKLTADSNKPEKKSPWKDYFYAQYESLCDTAYNGYEYTCDTAKAIGQSLYQQGSDLYQAISDAANKGYEYTCDTVNAIYEFIDDYKKGIAVVTGVALMIIAVPFVIKALKEKNSFSYTSEPKYSYSRHGDSYSSFDENSKSYSFFNKNPGYSPSFDETSNSYSVSNALQLFKKESISVRPPCAGIPDETKESIIKNVIPQIESWDLQRKIDPKKWSQDLDSYIESLKSTLSQVYTLPLQKLCSSTFKVCEEGARNLFASGIELSLHYFENYRRLYK